MLSSATASFTVIHFSKMQTFTVICDHTSYGQHFCILLAPTELCSWDRVCGAEHNEGVPTSDAVPTEHETRGSHDGKCSLGSSARTTRRWDLPLPHGASEW